MDRWERTVRHWLRLSPSDSPRRATAKPRYPTSLRLVRTVGANFW
jgi:hypothetical protein